jgi:hypothetical protein
VAVSAACMSCHCWGTGCVWCTPPWDCTARTEDTPNVSYILKWDRTIWRPLVCILGFTRHRIQTLCSPEDRARAGLQNVCYLFCQPNGLALISCMATHSQKYSFGTPGHAVLPTIFPVTHLKLEM